MTRAIHRITAGRLRIWLLTHGDQARLAVALVALVSIFCAVGYFDMQDEIALARLERDRATQVLADYRATADLPNPAIVIDAASAKRYGLRLAEIAGGLDAHRAEIRK